MKKKPNGCDILALLVRLLEDQEGVKITYETEGVSVRGDCA